MRDVESVSRGCLAGGVPEWHSSTAPGKAILPEAVGVPTLSLPDLGQQTLNDRSHSG